MDTFITLDQVKTYLGIDDTSYDPQLSAILKTTLALVKSKVGNLKHGEKEEALRKDTTSVKRGILLISGYNPTKLLEIDGKQVNEKDYMIMDNGTIQVLNLFSYVSSPFSHFKVKYEGGLKTNDELMSIVSELVAIEFAKDAGKEIQSEQTGPRSVTYVTQEVAGGSPLSKRDKLLLSLNKFTPPHLNSYVI